MQEDINYENLFSVLKFMLKMLVDADEFTFFIRREGSWEIYRTENDSIKQLSKEEEGKVNKEMQYIKPCFLYKAKAKDVLYPCIQEIIDARNYANVRCMHTYRIVELAGEVQDVGEPI